MEELIDHIDNKTYDACKFCVSPICWEIDCVILTD